MPYCQKVLNQYESRLTFEPNLNYLQKVRKRYDLNKNKKLLSLNINKRTIQKELRKSWLLDIENERRSQIGLDIFNSFDEMEDYKDNKDSLDQNSINLDDDYLLIESTKIINDFLNFSKKKMLSSVD